MKPVIASSVLLMLLFSHWFHPDNVYAASGLTDFNGDGYEDLAIGVPNESVGSVSEAGAVNVIYGSAGGLSATAARADQIWTQNIADVEGAVEESDHFGMATAAGDFNNDGFSDLAIGVPGEDVGTINAAGSVNVIYGSATGLSPTAKPDQLWSENSANIDGAADSSDAFGASLAAGDFNGDGRDDLAIGTPGDEAVHVIYGSATGLSATAVRADQIWTQNSPGIEGGTEAFDGFGAIVATGDFDGDDFDDLAIGVPNENVAHIDDGAVNVIYGSSSGLSATGDQIWSQDSPNMDDVTEEDDRFGWSIASGDFNRDGFGDLAIGVPGEDLSFANVGTVVVIYGSAIGLSASSPLADQVWWQDKVNVEGVSGPNDNFGSSLAANDYNGDGRDDLAVGVPAEPGAGDDIFVGAVNVIYGSSQGLRATAVAVGNGQADQLWTQNSLNIDDASENGDSFGLALATGDFNGDDKPDLAVGVPLEDVGSIVDAGAVNVIYGSSAGISAAARTNGDGRADQFWSQNTPEIIDFSEPGDSFGWLVRVADLF